MEAVVGMSLERKQELQDVFMGVRVVADKLPPGTNWYEAVHKSSGYAHYTFSGKVSDEMVEEMGRMLTGDEIIMLVDGGFSHFGASCSISGQAFRGSVNID